MATSTQGILLVYLGLNLVGCGVVMISVLVIAQACALCVLLTLLAYPLSWAALGLANRYGGSHAAHRGLQGASRKKKDVIVVAKEVQVSKKSRGTPVDFVQYGAIVVGYCCCVCLGVQHGYDMIIPVSSACQVLSIFSRTEVSLQSRLWLWWFWRSGVFSLCSSNGDDVSLAARSTNQHTLLPL